MKIFDKILELKEIYNNIQKKSDLEDENSVKSICKKTAMKKAIFRVINPDYWFLIGGIAFVSAVASFVPSIILKLSIKSNMIDSIMYSKGMFAFGFLIVFTFLLRKIIKSERDEIIKEDSESYNVSQDSIKLLMQYMYNLNQLNQEIKYLEDCYIYEDDKVRDIFEIYSGFEDELKNNLNDNNGKLMMSDFKDLKETIDDYQCKLEGYGANKKSKEILDTLREQIIKEQEQKTFNVQSQKEVVNEY